MASIRLGDLLVKAKVISDAQLQAALAEQQRWGGRLGEILVRQKTISEEMLVKAVSKQLGVPAVNLEQVKSLLPSVRGRLPSQVAKDLNALPLQLRDDGRTLVVAMAEPQNLKHLDTLRSATGLKIQPQMAGRQAIAKAYARLYDNTGEVALPPPEGSNGSFKLVDSQGHTLIREVNAPGRPSASRPASPPSGSVSERGPLETLKVLEEAQRKEVAALKAMVELLIDKGVFSREEYLARVKR
jgi:hypothetical protein